MSTQNVNLLYLILSVIDGQNAILRIDYVTVIVIK